MRWWVGLVLGGALLVSACGEQVANQCLVGNGTPAEYHGQCGGDRITQQTIDRCQISAVSTATTSACEANVLREAASCAECWGCDRAALGYRCRADCTDDRSRCEATGGARCVDEWILCYNGCNTLPDGREYPVEACVAPAM